MADRLETLGRRLVDARTEYDEKSRLADAAEERYRDAERTFWDALDDTSQKTTVLELGEGYGDIQFQRRETITSRILDEETLAAELEKMGLGEEMLGARKVRKKVSNEYVRDWLKSGQPLPEGMDFNARRYVTITKKGD